MRRPGRRGGALLVFAVMYVGFAPSVAWPTPERLARLAYLYQLAPSWVWGTVWAAAAGLAVIGAFVRRDAFAFAALEAVSTLWAMANLAAVVFGHDASAAGFAVLFGGVLLLQRIIDGWVDVPRVYLAGEQGTWTS
jgi:hypothetical protein